VNLHEEITNVAICGMGDSAKAIIANIQKDVPDFAALRDSDKPFHCNDPRQRAQVNDIAAQYDRKIDAAMEELSGTEKFAGYHIDERRRLGNEMRQTFAVDVARLNAIEGQLAGIWTFIGRMDLYHQAVNALELAGNDYASAYQRVAGFVGATNMGDQPANLDVSAVEKIASPPSLIPNLVARGGQGTTWMYLLFALLADGLAAFLWASTMFVLETTPGRATPLGNGEIANSDVRFLWVRHAQPE
jgi:hypothetical protein